MRFSRSKLAILGISFLTAAASCVMAQDPSPSTPTPQPQAQSAKRLTIEVTGGDQSAPIENASVYVKYIEEHAIKKDKKLELNVKTNREGLAHVPQAPLGRALVQIIADGWKTYGHWYDITDSSQVIKIHLERPPKWY